MHHLINNDSTIRTNDCSAAVCWDLPLRSISEQTEYYQEKSYCIALHLLWSGPTLSFVRSLCLHRTAKFIIRGGTNRERNECILCIRRCSFSSSSSSPTSHWDLRRSSSGSGNNNRAEEHLAHALQQCKGNGFILWH